MIVCSMTTHAPRLPHVGAALRSALDQKIFDVVILHVDRDISSSALAIADPFGVTVHVCEDIGPGKKHLAGMVIDDPDAIVVTLDDDHRYEPGHAARLVEGVKCTDRACGFVGYRLPELSTVRSGPAAFLSGAQGWAYRARWAPPHAVLDAGRDSALWHSDDVFMGRLMADNGNGCFVVEGELKNRFPPTNPEAYLRPESLQFHPDRNARTREAVRAAWGIG